MNQSSTGATGSLKASAGVSSSGGVNAGGPNGLSQQKQQEASKSQITIRSLMRGTMPFSKISLLQYLLRSLCLEVGQGLEREYERIYTPASDAPRGTLKNSIHLRCKLSSSNNHVNPNANTNKTKSNDNSTSNKNKDNTDNRNNNNGSNKMDLSDNNNSNENNNNDNNNNGEKDNNSKNISNNQANNTNSNTTNINNSNSNKDNSNSTGTNKNSAMNMSNSNNNSNVLNNIVIQYNGPMDRRLQSINIEKRPITSSKVLGSLKEAETLLSLFGCSLIYEYVRNAARFRTRSGLFVDLFLIEKLTKPGDPFSSVPLNAPTDGNNPNDANEEQQCIVEIWADDLQSPEVLTSFMQHLAPYVTVHPPVTRRM